MSSVREQFLELLEKDKEFRYAVAGYLGISEIPKKLDILIEEQIKLRKEQAKFSKELTKLREDFKELREEQIKLGKEQVKLREDFNKMLSVLTGMNKRLTRVERTLEKLTLDIEDEAKVVIENRLRDLEFI